MCSKMASQKWQSLLPSVRSIFRKVLGRFPSAININNCNDFSISVENENGGVATDT